MSGEPLLSLDDVYTSYGKSEVLRGVSLTVDPGEIVALLGRNGAGKTTTLRSIAGVRTPHRGTITFDSEDITGLAENVISNRGISYVAEERAIFPDLTVAGNLRMGMVAGTSGIFTLSEAYEFMPRLEERQNLLASDLSGGEQQMLVIARALLSNTEVLLLDEPTEGLAPQIVEDIIEVIGLIRDRGVPILVVEQNLQAVLGVSDRVYILQKGENIFEGTAKRLEGDKELQRQYLGVGASMG
jgi:branched-chain amino acid transport system ATP-binding protein